MPASDTEAEASEWLIRLETDPSPALQAAFEEWLAADPRNRAVYVRLEKTWRHADVLRRLRPLDGEVDENIIDKFAKPGAIVAIPRRAPWRRYLAIAASLLLVVLGGLGWMAWSRSGWQAYRTEQGGFQRISLQDGSTALLNTNSEIRVKLTSARREIVLVHGEALFTVAHDTYRPFDVTAADTVVRAVGTEFSVRLRDQQQVDVIVKEGRVAIDPPDESPNTKAAQQQPVASTRLSTLAAGEAVSVRSRKLTVRKIADEDMTRKLAWTQGRLWFDRVTLAEAVTEFNRYNRRQLVIDDPAIENLHIGGAFEATDLDSFVAALQSFGIRAVNQETGANDVNGGTVHLLGADSSQPP
ncbi:MAG: FecR domain-containing protein [Proteobacteria bacterium]|nr:FecR domain-containing protein [Pseudomonadota bacterium]